MRTFGRAFRLLWIAGIGVATALSMPMSTMAQAAYPNRPIRLIVPFAPGGSADSTARLVADGLQRVLGQPVVVDNQGGASGIIGTLAASRAAPDGYTLMFSTSSNQVIAPLLRQPRPYDPVKDFTPIAPVAVLPQLIVVAGDSPYKTLDDLLKKAKSAPNAVSYGTAGVGGSAHLASALLEMRSKTQMNHIPFKGNAPALTEVMSGRVDFMFYPMIGVSDYATAGKIRILAVTTAKRHPDYPQVPTTAELGFPGFEDYAQPIGFIAPAGLPAPIAAKIDAAIAAALAKPAMQARLKSLGAEVQHRGPADYREWLSKDRVRWAQLIRSANIKAE